jgi:phosphatidyl-myo-inositol dimannoside synthase
MRVLILATDIYTRGGIARYTRTLAEALGSLLGPENVDVLPLLGGTGPNFTPTRYRILESTTNTLNLFAKVRHTARSLLRSRKRYELIVCSHLSLTPLAALSNACYKNPYVAACYGAEAWYAFPSRVRLGVKGADLLLPISRHTRDMLHRVNGVSPEKMNLLYPAVPDDFAGLLTAVKGSRASSAPLCRPERILLSVGNLGKAHRYKGFDTVIRALPGVLEAVPDLQYVVVGDGDDRPYLEGLAAEIGVGSHVTFTGGLTDSELAAYYNACDVFVLPSRSLQHIGHWDGEGFGLVYIEAALAGKPVVGSLGGGAAEAVLHGRTGLLVEPTTVKQVMDATVTLLTNPELASRMGCEGRRWASQTFTTTGLRSSLKELLQRYSYSL